MITTYLIQGWFGSQLQKFCDFLTRVAAVLAAAALAAAALAAAALAAALAAAALAAALAPLALEGRIANVCEGKETVKWAPDLFINHEQSLMAQTTCRRTSGNQVLSFFIDLRT